MKKTILMEQLKMKKIILTVIIILAIIVTSGYFIIKESGCSNTLAQQVRKSGVFNTDYSAGGVSYSDSSMVDSSYYPYYTTVADLSLITGQVDSLNGSSKRGILYRAGLIVTCPTGVTCTPKHDTVWMIIMTKEEGGYRWQDCDTITLLGQASTDALTEGTCIFEAWPRNMWKLRFEEKKTLQHVNFTNRRYDYVLVSFTSINLDVIPSKINLGNY